MSATVYRLKASLRHIRPPIWRRLGVPGSLTLGQLHVVLQVAFGWTDSHLHQFRVGDNYFGVPDPEDFGPPVDDERKVRLEQVAAVRSRLVYDYDFGDGWEHDIVVEAVEPASEKSSRALCLDGRRACPPEDSGGPPGYDDLLVALAHPEEASELLEWIGPDWDPERFDLDLVNRELSALRLGQRPRAAASRAKPAARRAPRARKRARSGSS